MRTTSIAALLLAVPLTGCFDSGNAVAVTSSPTLVGVDPADFLGTLPCIDAPGAPRRYVVTLTAEAVPGEDASAPFTHPSSPPSDCNHQVTFGYVTPGRRYTAQVDVYDSADVTPLASGSPVMLSSRGQPVSPSWSTRCGDPQVAPGARPAISVGSRTVFVQPCGPLIDQRTETPPTGLQVSLEALQGGLVCAGEVPDEAAIARFRLSLTGDSRAAEATCGARTLALTELSPGVRHELTLHALGPEGDVRYHTECSGVTADKLILPASCAPLTAGGAGGTGGTGGTSGAAGAGGTGGTSGAAGAAGTGGTAGVGGTGGTAGAGGVAGTGGAAGAGGVGGAAGTGGAAGSAGAGGPGTGGTAGAGGTAG
ncbi:MAG: hypothetical protein KIT72_14115 [Polyangiaceae bacterium]|nr:hypothetical protein [Polyangiaceae bacterium]